MLTVTNYYTDNGRIIGEKVGSNARTDYLTDALGSVTATVNQSAQVVNTYRYKPYGAQLSKTGSGSDPAFRWNGSWGYRPTALQHSDYYVRARHYATAEGRWTTVEPTRYRLGMGLYVYVRKSPVFYVDPTGRFAWIPVACAVACACSALCALAVLLPCIGTCRRSSDPIGCMVRCVSDVVSDMPTWAKLLCGACILGCGLCIIAALAVILKSATSPTGPLPPIPELPPGIEPPALPPGVGPPALPPGAEPGILPGIEPSPAPAVEPMPPGEGPCEPPVRLPWVRSLLWKAALASPFAGCVAGCLLNDCQFDAANPFTWGCPAYCLWQCRGWIGKWGDCVAHLCRAQWASRCNRRAR
jgi:RHS repeat-associated protein